MSGVKNILKSVINSSFEVAKDSTRELTKAVSPTKMAEQAFGTPPPPQESEFSKYIKGIGNPELRGEKLTQAQQEERLKAEQDANKIRATILSGSNLPSHMRPQVEKREPSVHEKQLKEEDEKKRQEETARAQSEKLAVPLGKVRLKPGQRRPKAADMEVKQNIKIG